MNNVLICEGSTDYSLLQYYMREACGWIDDRTKQNNIIRVQGQKSRNLIKNQDILTIMSTGGCSRLGEGLRNVLSRNMSSAPDLSDAFTKVVIITDRDEVNPETDFIASVENIFSEFGVVHREAVSHNKWNDCEMVNSTGKKLRFSLLLLIIPFEETGAMESFLLSVIAANDDYDKNIIEQCKNFVDNVDPEKRYLTGRRIITKAKFDTYFSVRTPAEQFVERQNILKSVKWEEYAKIQQDFELLNDL